MTKRAIGIIGGMGPMATLDLFGKLIAHTDAHTDAEHIRVYMDCHTGIPDRTRAILHGGESPVPYILESAEKLVSIGAELLLIPCNTSHYYYTQICEGSRVPVMNMIRETAQSLHKEGVDRVGLLATDGTLQAGVYQRELTALGIHTVPPDEAEQREVMRLIYDGVKADAPAFATQAITAMLERMEREGVQRVILGCTELPLGFDRYGLSRKGTVDPADILARAAVKAAGYPIRDSIVPQDAAK